MQHKEKIYFVYKFDYNRENYEEHSGKWRFL